MELQYPEYEGVSEEKFVIERKGPWIDEENFKIDIEEVHKMKK